MPRPRVLLAIDTATPYGRGVLAGIGLFARGAGWDLGMAEWVRGMAAGPPDFTGCDGAIGRFHYEDLVAHGRAAPVPVVNVSSAADVSTLPSVVVDDAAVGRLAGEYFVSRGIRHLAFYAARARRFSALRGAAFAAVAASAGGTCAELTPDAAPTLETRRELVAAWLRSLPRPLGLLAHNDFGALQILGVCRAVGIAVPDEVAVVGVDDDPTVCALASPPLSSVTLPLEQIGFRAAALLRDLMAGAPPPPGPILLAPLAVAGRASSDRLAIADPEVAAALRFIHARALSGIQVEDVLGAVPLSRSVLERRFRAMLGRAPAAEIRRLRIEHAQGLLAGSDQPIQAVARATGFRTARQFTTTFANETGMTPTVFRRRYRPTA